MQNMIVSNGRNYELTQHAQRRMAQRNISPRDIQIVLAYGQRDWTYRGQAYALGRRHIPSDMMARDDVRRLEGTVVIVTENNETIITVYRNRDFRQLRKKRSA